jgi:hypothetical protein
MALLSGLASDPRIINEARKTLQSSARQLEVPTFLLRVLSDHDFANLLWAVASAHSQKSSSHF